MGKKHTSSILGEVGEYYSAIGRIKPMTRDEEIACATALKETGDRRYARKLVEANLLPTLKFVLRYNHFGLPVADLIQEGNLGLVKALEKFDVSRGYRFMTYARWHVKARVHRYLQKNWRMVTIKKSDSWKKLFDIVFSFKEMSRLQRGAIDGKTTVFELLGKKIGVPAEEAEKMLNVFFCDEVHLDQPTSADGEIGNASQLEKSLSLFGIAHESDPAEEFLVKEVVLFEGERICYALNTLTDLERLIVRRRFLRPHQWTLQEIGDDVGFTKERIRQLQNGAIEKLRKYFINESYKGGEKEG